jgi:DNA-binding CsgD family transcriptional regulator/class 3 adenylate cyclase
MPYFIDHHSSVLATPEEMALAHARDLDVETKHGVRFLTYWLEDSGDGYCLVEAEKAEDAVASHLEAHGQAGVPAEILEVDYESVLRHLGQIHEPKRGEAWKDSAFRALVWAAVDDTPGLTRRLGDEEALRVMRIMKRMLIYAIGTRGGREIRQLGEGMLGCFTSVVAAIESALAIRRAVAEYSSSNPEATAEVRIGIGAGEPVTDQGEIFGAAVQMAELLCGAAQPGTILVSGTVHDLCAGKGVVFSLAKDVVLRGLEDSVPAFEVFAREPVVLEARAVERPTSQPAPGGPSPREVEVLRLIADGNTNQEIADALFISLNTVYRHVSNIFGKAGLSNRAEAAGFAFRNNIV